MKFAPVLLIDFKSSYIIWSSYAMFYISIFFLHLLYLHPIKGGRAIFHIVIFKLNASECDQCCTKLYLQWKVELNIYHQMSVRLHNILTSYHLPPVLTSESHLWSCSVESLATSGTTGCATMCTTNEIQQKPLHT